MGNMEPQLRQAALRAIQFRRWALLAIFITQAAYLQARVQLTPCDSGISPAQQIQLGNKAKEQVYKQMPILPDSSPVTQYISALGHKLAAHAPGYKWPYNFHVANVSDINAFALPGGSVFVNLGTIQAADTEAQLAGVMAHEISHVVLQHSACNIKKEQKYGLFAGLGQVLAGVFLGNGAAGQLAQEGIGITAQLGFLRMSRGDEKQADEEGAQILYDAGYDPRGMVQFFETIESKYGNQSAQFLSDHPNPGNRQEYVSKEIATFPKRAHNIVTTPEFKQISSRVAKMHAYTAKEISSGVWKSQSPNQAVGSATNQASGGSVEPASPDLNTSGPWKQFSGTGFTLQVPANWNAYGSQASAMIGPPGGIVQSPTGAATLIVGLLTKQFRPQQRLDVRAAFDALLSEITRENPGMRPGQESELEINGMTGRSVQANNPSANNGTGEHEWIVAFPEADGSLRYFVFVAPAPDYPKVQSAFKRILRSVRVQG